MTLTLFKSTDQYRYCHMYLTLSLSDVFSWLEWVYAFLAKIPQKQCYVLITISYYELHDADMKILSLIIVWGWFLHCEVAYKYLPQSFWTKLFCPWGPKSPACTMRHSQHPAQACHYLSVPIRSPEARCCPFGLMHTERMPTRGSIRDPSALSPPGSSVSSRAWVFPST